VAGTSPVDDVLIAEFGAAEFIAKQDIPQNAAVRS
jgi:hypothetical protein